MHLASISIISTSQLPTSMVFCRDTLAAAHNLATSLFRQGKHAAAEAMEREALAVRKRGAGGGASRHAGSREQPAAIPVWPARAKMLW